MVRHFLRERSEEIRSRLSLMQSTLSGLKQTYWTVFSSYFARNRCSPFIFPVSTFRRLEGYIAELYGEVSRLDPETLIADSVLRLDALHDTCDELLSELVRLQNVLSQRMSGLGVMKLIEYEPASQVEFGTISKTYNVVDAITFDLVKKMLGNKWIEDNQYVPISLFDHEGYMIDIYSYIISIPYYDNFRSRFWPALAHEVAHIMVSQNIRQPGLFRDTIGRGVDRLMGDLNLQLEPATFQVIELTSDIISSYVCPPAFLSATINIGIPIELESGALVDSVRYAYHPPLDCRLKAMERILELTDVLDSDNDLKNFSEDVRMLFARKNLNLLSSESYDMLEKYNEFAQDYAEFCFRTLSQMGINSFDGTEWDYVMQAFSNMKMIQYLSPSQLMALAWVKRIRITKNDVMLSMQDYYERRRREEKFFEQIVGLIYKYYELEIVQKVQMGDLYDLRIGTC